MRLELKLIDGAWELVKDTIVGFVDDDALSRGASIAYYTLFAIAPVLPIIVAIAGMVFGRDAAEGAIVDQLSDLMGTKTAEALEAMIKSASNPAAGTLASIIGLVAVFVAATGVFGEVQSAMNAIWKAEPHPTTLTRFMWARLVSLVSRRRRSWLSRGLNINRCSPSVTGSAYSKRLR